MKLSDEFHGIPQLVNFHIWINDYRGRGNHNAHGREHCHSSWQRDDLAESLFPLAVTKASEIRHIQTQRRPESNHSGKRNNEGWPKLTEGMKCALLSEQITESVRSPNCPPEQQRSHNKYKRRRPVLDSSEQIHAAINNVDVQTPEKQKRNPFSGRMTADWAAK